MDPSAIPGATPTAVCDELRRLAAAVPADQTIVEIGVYYGRSVCYLGQGSLEGQRAPVVGIDPWDLPGRRLTYEQYVANYQGPSIFTDPSIRLAANENVRACGLEEIVTLVRGFAHTIAPGWMGAPVGLMYIDGDHRCESILRDFVAWRKHMHPGAVLVFDDYHAPFDGVLQAVDGLHADGVLTTPQVLHGRIAVARLQ